MFAPASPGLGSDCLCCHFFAIPLIAAAPPSTLQAYYPEVFGFLGPLSSMAATQTTNQDLSRTTCADLCGAPALFFRKPRQVSPSYSLKISFLSKGTTLKALLQISVWLSLEGLLLCVPFPATSVPASYIYFSCTSASHGCPVLPGAQIHPPNRTSQAPVV